MSATMAVAPPDTSCSSSFRRSYVNERAIKKIKKEQIQHPGLTAMEMISKKVRMRK